MFLKVLALVHACISTFSWEALTFPHRIKCQLHGPYAQGPHVCQRTVDALLTVSLRGLEGHAQPLPNSPVTTFCCAHPLFVHALRIHMPTHQDLSERWEICLSCSKCFRNQIIKKMSGLLLWNAKCRNANSQLPHGSLWLLVHRPHQSRPHLTGRWNDLALPQAACHLLPPSDPQRSSSHSSQKQISVSSGFSLLGRPGKWCWEH